MAFQAKLIHPSTTLSIKRKSQGIENISSTHCAPCFGPLWDPSSILDGILLSMKDLKTETTFMKISEISLAK
jgi:hypothetical protein